MTDRDSGNKSFTQKDESGSDKTQDDSKTSDVSLLGRIRKHDDRVTIRINKQFKEAIKRHCSAKGLSICHINDGLWFGYLLGWNEKLDLDVKSPTINLTLVRDVKRVRRYAVEVDESNVVETVAEPKCDLCGKPLVIARFRHVESGIEKNACDFHAEDLRSRSDWKEIPLCAL